MTQRKASLRKTQRSGGRRREDSKSNSASKDYCVPSFRKYAYKNKFTEEDFVPEKGLRSTFEIINGNAQVERQPQMSLTAGHLQKVQNDDENHPSNSYMQLPHDPHYLQPIEGFNSATA